MGLDEVYYVVPGDTDYDSCPSDRLFSAGLWVVGVGSATTNLTKLLAAKLLARTQSESHPTSKEGWLSSLRP
jgi:hypothetical protein